MRYTEPVIKICSFASTLLIKTDQNRSSYSRKKTEPKKTETAVFAIKTDRNRTGKSKPNLSYPTIYSRATNY